MNAGGSDSQRSRGFGLVMGQEGRNLFGDNGRVESLKDRMAGSCPQKTLLEKDHNQRGVERKTKATNTNNTPPGLVHLDPPREDRLPTLTLRVEFLRVASAISTTVRQTLTLCTET